MSLFKGEALPEVKSISFMRRGTPLTPASTSILWHDQTQNSIVGQVSGTNVAPVLQCLQNVTPVNVTNSTAATALMSCPLALNLANAVGKTLKVFCAGNYNTGTPAGGPTTLTFVVQMGGVNVLSFTSGATTNAQANMPWEIEGTIIVAAMGAAANVEAHGTARVTLGTSAGGSTTTYLDTTSAVSSAINLQANANVACVAAITAADATTLVNQRLMTVTVAN